MTKLTGFVLLQLSALMFLRRRLAAEKRRAENAASFRNILEHLLGLLERESSPMPELLQLLQKRVHGAAARFVSALLDSMDMLGVHSFQELWRRALYAGSEDMDQELGTGPGVHLSDPAFHYDHLRAVQPAFAEFHAGDRGRLCVCEFLLQGGYFLRHRTDNSRFH